MPYPRPTLTDLVRDAEAEIDAALPGADARLPASNLNVIARVDAGGLHGLYGYIAWVADQLFPDSAEAEHLERHAGVWGILRKPAASAAGTVTVTGNDGAVVPAGWSLQRADGMLYATAGAVVIAGGAAVLTVIAVQPGAAGNAAAGTALRAVSPAAGVRSEVVVGTGGLSAGADAEADAGLLTRLLERIQQPPHGGAKHDYAAWAKAVPGVDEDRVWVLPRHMGPGTVGVTFLAEGSAIPGEALVDAVRAAIEAERPVTAVPVVFAPGATAVPLGLSISPDTPELRQAVEAALAAFFWAEAAPGGTLRLSRLSAAISAVAGIDHHRLSAPAADVPLAAGCIAVPGAITWGA